MMGDGANLCFEANLINLNMVLCAWAFFAQASWYRRGYPWVLGVVGLVHQVVHHSRPDGDDQLLGQQGKHHQVLQVDLWSSILVQGQKTESQTHQHHCLLLSSQIDQCSLIVHCSLGATSGLQENWEFYPVLIFWLVSRAGQCPWGGARQLCSPRFQSFQFQTQFSVMWSMQPKKHWRFAI